MIWRCTVLWLLYPVIAATLPAQSTVNPHGVLRESCATCHRSESWTPARISRDFRHAPRTFPLEGAHGSTACTSCHRRLDFQETPGRCASCHEDVHRGELGADCARCHTARSFLDPAGVRRVHELTRFPLRGAHVGAACTACHAPAGPGQFRFVNRSVSCIGCHASDAAAVPAPNHTAAPYTSECSACHSMLTWRNARFDHALSGFPLTGAHRTTTCDGCHGDGVFAGKSNACVSCHQTDYDQTTSPAHAAAGFPTLCASCHTTTRWQGAAFDHDGPYFPIYSGKHRGKWSTCATCHTSPSSYKVFTCLTCHEHSQTEMDGKHQGRAGYRYESQACYACHPRGDDG